MRIALDKFCAPRASSIVRIRPAMLVFFWSAICCSSAQNSSSSVKLVACPAIVMECFFKDGMLLKCLVSLRDKRYLICNYPFGPTISSGLTHASNCSDVKRPSAIPASLRDVSSACAFFAIFAALSYPIWGLSAVTSIKLSRINFVMRVLLGSIPTTQCAVKLRDASEIRRIDCKTL
jgi:hypothetical protein